MINVDILIKKIDYLRNNESVLIKESDKNFLNKQRNELIYKPINSELDLFDINNQLYKIAKIYLGLEDLERWFPEKTKENHKQPPPSY